MEHDLPHDPDEGIVDRVLESLENGRVRVVFPPLEIGEYMHAAAGEERAGTARIAALHGRIDHRLQTAVGRFREIPGRPCGDRIALALAAVATRSCRVSAT